MCSFAGDVRWIPPLPSRIGKTLGKTNDCPSKYNAFKISVPILVLGKNIFAEISRSRLEETSLFGSFGHYLVFSHIFV